MTRPDHDYLTDLAVQLRLTGMNGEQIGAILEEARDHLDASGQDPQEAFGPASDYAESLASSQGVTLPRRPLQLTPADLVGAAVQLLGFVLLLGGAGTMAAAAAGGSSQGVDLLPGHVAGLVLLTAAMVWPLWPATRAYMAREVTIVIPFVSVLAVIAAFVGLTTWWAEPVLVTMPSWAAIVLGAALIAGVWIRVWFLRDPVRRPAGDEPPTT